LAKGKKTPASPPSSPPAGKPASGGGTKPPQAAREGKEAKEKVIKAKIRGPFVVGAREEEMDMVQRETHSCGGGFEIEMEVVRPPTENTGPLDVLKTLCTECGAHVDFLFDISSFYDDEESEFEAAPAGGGDEPPEGEDDEGGWLS